MRHVLSFEPVMIVSPSASTRRAARRAAQLTHDAAPSHDGGRALTVVEGGREDLVRVPLEDLQAIARLDVPNAASAVGRGGDDLVPLHASARRPGTRKVAPGEAGRKSTPPEHGAWTLQELT